MTNQDTIQELKELNSLLAGIPSGNCYAVPDGYFDTLAAQVLARIKALTDSEETRFSQSISTETPYSVPAGYFDSLAGNVMAAIRRQEEFASASEEIAALSPLLSSIEKENPYSVPAGYFENLSKDINLKPVEVQRTKVVSMVNRTWFRYAAAAIVIGFITVTGIQFLNSNPVSVSNPHAWVEKNMNKVSTDDINNFIQVATDDGSASQNSLVSSAKATDIKDLMQDVSDKDIQDFLNKTSSNNDDGDADLLLN